MMISTPMAQLRFIRLILVGATALALASCSSGPAKDADSTGEAAPEAGAAEPGEVPASAPDRVVLTAAAEQTAGIQVETVGAAALGPATSAGLDVPGEVQIDSSRVAVVSSRAPGRIERLSAAQGQAVGAGQTVATLSSPEYLAAQSDLVQAVRRAKLLEGTSDEQGAQALVGAARQRLLLLGASPEQIRRLLAEGQPSLLLPVPAPFSGTILETLAQAGMAVSPGEPIFRIANLSTMHVIARVPEQSLALVHPGQRATVTVPAYGTTRTGRVLRILEELDPETRTARVVVEVPNPGRALKAGMFATVRLATAAAVSNIPAGPATGVSVPSAAVLTDGDARYLFVRVAPRTFEKRVVQVATPLPGAATGDRVVVTAGLRAGEAVVVRGAFVLRSELAKAGLEDTD